MTKDLLGWGSGRGMVACGWAGRCGWGAADRKPCAADKRKADPLLQRAGLMCVVELSASINHNVRVSGIVVQLRSHFFPHCVKEWIRIDICLGDPLA